jgi:hypothetical protein
VQRLDDPVLPRQPGRAWLVARATLRPRQLAGQGVEAMGADQAGRGRHHDADVGGERGADLVEGAGGAGVEVVERGELLLQGRPRCRAPGQLAITSAKAWLAAANSALPAQVWLRSSRRPRAADRVSWW